MTNNFSPQMIEADELTRHLESKKRYRIVRFYYPSQEKRPRRTGKSGLTLAQAQAHCSDPKTRKEGQYFDGYEKE